MPVFSFTALDHSEKTVAGTIPADNARHAREILRDRGLEIKSVSERTSVKSRTTIFQRGSYSTSVTLYRELGTLLGVGIPLRDALIALSAQHRGRTSILLSTLAHRIEEGKSLAAALVESGATTDEVSLQLVKVGEESGELDAMLCDLADLKERQLEVKDQVLTALIYPSIVVVVGLLVCAFLTTFVVPMLLTSLEQSGKPLPLPTRILKQASDLVNNNATLLLCVFAAFAVTCVLLGRQIPVRRFLHKWMLKLPFWGNLVIKQDIARVTMVLATLLKTGTRFVAATELAAKASRNLVIREGLMQASTRIADGMEIGDALESQNFLPVSVVHVFRLGQSSGELDELLHKLSVSYDREVKTQSKRLSVILEPVLIVVIAIFVGFILFATILPILETSNVL